MGGIIHVEASYRLHGCSRFNDDTSLLDSTRNGVNWTLTYHGDPAGSIIGDEREAGLAPNRGYDYYTLLLILEDNL